MPQAIQFLSLAPYAQSMTPRRIAFRMQRGSKQDGDRPTLIWFPGLKSTMVSTKATAVAAWATTYGLSYLRFDYSGHGQSSGRFEDGRIGAWIDEARAVIDHAVPADQRRVIIASSMGAHLALRMMLETSLPWRAQVVVLILIAPAWNATQALMWDRFTPDIRATIAQSGVYLRPSRYGDGPYAITRGLLDDGRRFLLPDGPLRLPCPVHILHGAEDPDVPLAHGIALRERMVSPVEFDIISDGDHRLSRPEDLDRLLQVIEQVVRR
jgi:pimeloyl-ACP methyl ester carboxylesterase